MRIPALYATSIICGFCMMALEILGGRVLFPSFGSSIDVWAAIITVFILSLSIGYVLGGKIADKANSNVPLAWVILVAGILYCLLPTYALGFSESLGESVHNARWGVLFGALVLFLPPSLLLGMVSPMLVKLVFVSADKVGTTTGVLYAIGSFGNVIGILVADYVLLAYVPLNQSILWMGMALGVLGVLHLLKRIEGHSHHGASVETAP